MAIYPSNKNIHILIIDMMSSLSLFFLSSEGLWHSCYTLNSYLALTLPCQYFQTIEGRKKAKKRKLLIKLSDL